MEQRYGTDPSRGYGTGYGTGVWNGCGPGACSGPPILTCTHIMNHRFSRHPNNLTHLLGAGDGDLDASPAGRDETCGHGFTGDLTNKKQRFHEIYG